ncbi:MAG: lysylphosphatidylglycerol synthase transmembrane domain-containing protein [Bacteroidota bacterium]
MDRKRIYRSFFFLVIGILIFWNVFRDTDFQDVLKEFRKFNWFWIAASISLNLLSQLTRAIRWKILFSPLDYSPGLLNLFFSMLILGFTNQIIPRGGEIARLGMVHRYEKIPFAKLFGTALVERLTDLIILLLIFITLIIWQFSLFLKILALPEINPENISWKKILLILGIITAIVLALWLIFRYFKIFSKIRDSLKKIREDVSEGFKSLSRIKNKSLFFTLSFLIYAFWLVMLYVLFFAYPPTADLSFKAAAFTFGLATLAFLLPIQAGIGAWHFVVIQCLLLFGIDAETGQAFSLVAHAATNLVYIPLGAIAFLFIFLLNDFRTPSFIKNKNQA